MFLKAVFKELRVPKIEGENKIIAKLMEELDGDRLYLENLVSQCGMYFSFKKCH